MMIKNKIMASVVLYNPDIARLEENILSVYEQVEKVLLVDNGSKNISNIEMSNIVKKRCILIRNKENMGLATALNQIMQFAYEHNYEWVLTLDQDTICQPNLVYKLSKHIAKERVGIIAPKFVDRNCRRMSDGDEGWKYVLRCITSASLTNVAIWKAVNGFTDDLFIDYVDYDYCAKLIRNGFGIIKDSDVSILHEIGHSKRIYIAGKFSYILYNHSAMRDYYIVRNTLYYCYTYPDVWNVQKDKKELAIRCIMILLFETDKIAKFCSIAKGFWASKRLIKEEKIKQSKHRAEVRKEIKKLRNPNDKSDREG